MFRAIVPSICASVNPSVMGGNRFAVSGRPTVVPAILISPVISGIGFVGQVLTTTNGVWSQSPSSFTYRWLRNGVAISGATSSTYTVVTADEGTNVTSEVTATNIIGDSLPATSNTIVPGRLIDTLRNVIAAYSFRKLRLAYAGACIRVRRDSDNLEQDIGFDSAGVCDYAAMATFCGAASGFCVTWYDQSGAGLNITNATGSTQFNTFFAGSSQNGCQAVSGVTRFLQTTNAAFSLSTSEFTSSLVANTVNLGGTSFGRMFNFGSAGGARVMMATQSSTGGTPRLLVQRPAGGTEWYSTPGKDVANGESVIVTDKGATADINAMTSWINGGDPLVWGPSRGLGTMDGSFVVGAASNDTGTGFIFREFILANVKYTTSERNWMTANQGAYFGATIT